MCKLHISAKRVPSTPPRFWGGRLLVLASILPCVGGCVFSKAVSEHMGTTYEGSNAVPNRVLVARDGTVAIDADAFYFSSGRGNRSYWSLRWGCGPGSLSTKRRYILAGPQLVKRLVLAERELGLWVDSTGGVQHRALVLPVRLNRRYPDAWRVLPSGFDDPSALTSMLPLPFPSQWTEYAHRQPVPYDVNSVVYPLLLSIESGRERAFWAKVLLPVVLPLMVVADIAYSPILLLTTLSAH